MKVRTISLAEARKRFNDWKAGERLQLRLSEEYEAVRRHLFILYAEAVEETASLLGSRKERQQYTTDVIFGIKLYDWLKRQTWFSLRTAADPGFWRYLAVAVAPDLIRQRWDAKSTERYFSRTTHIYFGSLWWYVYLSWNKNSEMTQKLLLSPNMTSDTINNLVDRIGAYGIYVDVYRNIMFCFSRLKKEMMIGRKRVNAREMFRSVMKLHMAKAATVDPVFFQGGPKEYVLSLFKESGLDDTDFQQLRRCCYD